ncbi:MAG TPA: hypothetical protein VF077_00520 [Nitrospiraceae bacterium]
MKVDNLQIIDTPEPRLRVTRIIEIEGPETWVRTTLVHALVSPTDPVCWPNGKTIREISRTEFKYEKD